MNSPRRAMLGVAAIACIAASFAAYSQAYPTKPIRTITTTAGGAEVIARLISQRLGEALGQPVVIESQAGAGGAVGTSAVARAAPDGYTVLFANASAIVLRKFLVKELPYDPIKSFTPLGKVADVVLVVISHPALPVNSIKELIEYSKRNPGKISYGSLGIGSSHHLSGEMIRLLTGVEWVHVPFKGSPPVLTEVMTGRIQVGLIGLGTVTPQLNTGKFKLLAVNNAARYHVIGDTPTVAEQLPGYEHPPAWNGYFGPAGLPQSIVKRFNTELVKAMNQPDVRAKADSFGFMMTPSTPEEQLDMLKRELATIAKLVKAAGIEPE